MSKKPPSSSNLLASFCIKAPASRLTSICSRCSPACNSKSDDEEAPTSVTSFSYLRREQLAGRRGIARDDVSEGNLICDARVNVNQNFPPAFTCFLNINQTSVSTLKLAPTWNYGVQLQITEERTVLIDLLYATIYNNGNYALLNICATKRSTILGVSTY